MKFLISLITTFAMAYFIHGKYGEEAWMVFTSSVVISNMWAAFITEK